MSKADTVKTMGRYIHCIKAWEDKYVSTCVTGNQEVSEPYVLLLNHLQSRDLERGTEGQRHSPRQRQAGKEGGDRKRDGEREQERQWDRERVRERES